MNNSYENSVTSMWNDWRVALVVLHNLVYNGLKYGIIIIAVWHN